MSTQSTAAGTRAHDMPGMHESEGSLGGYLTGFVLAAILTIIPFWLVMGHVFESRGLTIFLVLALAVIQIVVHLVFFLHLNTHSQEGWNMIAFIFAAILVTIVLGASVWALYHENALMMPMAPAVPAHQMPAS
jgi:cytochrome o ubiquinol oxidase operon protein cyoD